jgi:hypothetical protein
VEQPGRATAQERSELRTSTGTGMKRWPAVRWWLSLLLPIALVLWAISLVIAPGEPDLLVISVESQVTGERLPDASILVGDVSYVADEQGEITIEPVPPGTALEVAGSGHETHRREIPEPGHGRLTVPLSGVLVYGTVVDAQSEQPVTEADVSVLDSDGRVIASAHTDEFGSFIFKFIPEDAMLAIKDDVYGESAHALRDQRSLLIALDPPPVTGRVVDERGEPLRGVDVSDGEATSVTDDEGRFVLSGVGQGSEVTISYGKRTSAAVIEGRDMGDIVLDKEGGPSASPEVTPG